MNLRKACTFCFAFAPAIFARTTPARAADLVISDLMVSYQTHTETTATGQLTFNIRLASDESDTLGFDLFSAQVLVREMIADGAKASFTLNESATEAAGPAKDGYWISAGIDGTSNASSVGGEFRFSDFLLLGNAVVPPVNAVLAGYSINFEVTDASQFGIYEIAPGDASFNFFSRDLVVSTPTNLTPATFELGPPIPEPATVVLLLGCSGAVIRRRRR